MESYGVVDSDEEADYTKMDQGTNYSEIQWEEGKSVQGNFFLTIIEVTKAYAVAVNSS